MASKNEGMGFNEIMQVLQDFLEVAIHNILYLRSVYPADLFEKYKKYNVPVYKARHPHLSAYIAEIVKSAMENITKGLVKKLIVAVKDGTTDDTMEHFVFSLLWVKPIAFFQDENAVRNVESRFDSGMSRSDAELMLRAFLLKLSTVEAQLGTLTSDLTFAVIIELADEVTMPIRPADEPIPWLPASMEEERVVEEAYKNSNLHALKWTQFGIVDLSLQVEECPEKLKVLKQERDKYLSSGESIGQPRFTADEKGKGRA